MTAFRISSQARVPKTPGNGAAAAPSAEPPPSAGGAGFTLSGPQLSGQVAALLAVVAAHDRISPAEFVARAACARAEEIGIAFLASPVLTAEGLGAGRRTTGGPQSRPGADFILQGGEVASRLAHNQEVGRSNRPPATSITPESGDQGGGGNPAAPAGKRAPP